MKNPIRVLIADDSFVVRSGLRNFVDALSGFEVVAEAASGREAVAKARGARPDVVLMDLRMREGDGIVATRELAATLAETCTLVVSWSDEPEHIRDAIAARAGISSTGSSARPSSSRRFAPSRKAIRC